MVSFFVCLQVVRPSPLITTVARLNMRRLKSKRLAITLMIAAILCIPFAYLFLLFRSFASFPDAYASDWTVVFVTDHIHTTGEWPKGWDDLKDEYDRMAPASHYAWTFDELQERVWLDWDADLDSVRSADPPQTIFRLTSGREASFNGDPNDLIRNFLRTGEAPWMKDLPIETGG